VAIGVAIGVPAAILLSQFVKSQLFGLEPHDPSTILASTVLLALVAGLAGLIPALRASRIDPMRALHYE
jgi:ABC-type antimicrobial peptide transport system permease subunit